MPGPFIFRLCITPDMLFAVLQFNLCFRFFFFRGLRLLLLKPLFTIHAGETVKPSFISTVHTNPSRNRRNFENALRFSVDRKNFVSGAFQKRWRLNNPAINPNTQTFLPRAGDCCVYRFLRPSVREFDGFAALLCMCFFFYLIWYVIRLEFELAYVLFGFCGLFLIWLCCSPGL